MRTRKVKLIRAIIYIMVALLFMWILEPETTDAIVKEDEVQEFKYSDYLKDMDAKLVKAIYFNAGDEVLYVEKTDGTYYKTQNPDYDTFKKDVLERGVIIGTPGEILGQTKKTSDLVIGLIGLFKIITVVAIANLFIQLTDYVMKSREMNKKRRAEPFSAGPSSIPFSQEIIYGSTREKKNPNIKTFKDIAGLNEVKKDVECLVDFLKNKTKYVEAGAELPRGVIFYGPPGTGKTLLAKAIAGEAGVPFHYMSGSDFIELYVGVGAKRVRELFDKAKKDAPCIIFIDEIDAIGCKRDMTDMGGESRKTINALLSEMDGFLSSDNILVIGATNRIEDLDDALLRPGRFTNKFCVPLPETSKERLEILKMYAANKRIADDVSFDSLAAETLGFSPAAIESLLNEAAIISVQDNKGFIDKKSIDKAMFKVLMAGHAKEDQSDRKREELELVAWHEAGHALLGKLNGKKIPKVTIVASTSGAGGATFSTPNKLSLHTAAEIKAEIRELYAGRVAEFMLKGNKELITTGASNDIERATQIIQEYITTYGMHEHFGLLNLSKLKVNQAEIIDQAIKLAKLLEQETLEILTDNEDKLKSIANLLLDKETIYDEDLTRIVGSVSE